MVLSADKVPLGQMLIQQEVAFPLTVLCILHGGQGCCEKAEVMSIKTAPLYGGVRQGLHSFTSGGTVSSIKLYPAMCISVYCLDVTKSHLWAWGGTSLRTGLV